MKSNFTITALLLVTTMLSAQENRYKQIEKNTMDGTKYGIFDTKTNIEIIPATYDKVVDLTEGKFAVIKENKVGVADTLNKMIFPIQYTDVTNCMEDRIFISNGKKWAMADAKGKILTQFLYDAALGYSEEIGRITMNNKIGYINSQGGIIIPCKFDEAYDCYAGTIIAYATSWESSGFDIVSTQQGKETGRQNVGISGTMPVIFNKKGAVIYKGEHQEKVKYSPDGKLILIEKSSLSTSHSKVLDNTGKVVVPYEKGYYLEIQDNWIKITSNEQGKYGIMNFKGEVILKPNFSEISLYEFNNNQLAKVTFPNGDFFYIDKNAKCMEFDNKKCPE